MTNWDTYYKQHQSRKPREIVVRAASLCKEKNRALDLGAGTLIESHFLIESGFKKVTAIDSSPEVLDFAKKINSDRLEVFVTRYRDLTLDLNTYDLITAQYALPFFGKEGFDEFLEKVIGSLKKGGVFVGQFFGDRDGWNKPEKDMTFQTKAEALKLLANLNIIEFIEEEKEGTTAAGDTKHWHVFHFIAVK